MNHLQGSGVSDRSRCGAVRILELTDEPSTWIGRVGALSLWCRANPSARRRTLCGDRACRIARRRTLCGDRCGAVRILELADEPSAGIGRVEAVVPCESLVSERARCDAVRILPVADEASTGIKRVGALSLWCRAHPCRGR